MKKILITSILSIICVFAACKKDEIETYDCTGLTPTYTVDVKPLLDANCATSGCHDASSTANGLDYSTYETTKSGASSDAFMGSMQHLSGYDDMPRNGDKLSDTQLQTISCWIENGMME